MEQAEKRIVHYKQSDALSYQSRFNFWLTGRRGGKTTGIIEDMCDTIPQMPRNTGMLYIGPTNIQAKEIIWDELVDRMDELNWRPEPKKNEQRIYVKNGRYVQVLGAEKIRRVRGKKYYKAYLDEVAYYTMKLDKIWLAVRPTLSDFGGGAFITTTPAGKGTDAYLFYMAAKSKEDWSIFEWDTADNPFIDPSEIDSARRDLDPKSFEQEYLAKWVSFDGLAYYCFDERIHVKKQPPINFELPLSLALDFNVNPTSLLIVQNELGKHRVKKEYSFKNSSTIKTMENFCEDFKEQKSKIHVKIHGDASGSSRRSGTGFSDYHYIRELLTKNEFKFTMNVPAANPPIVDRLNHTNAYLLNAAKESRTEIDPSCKDLILDLSSQTLEGRFPSDKGNLGHKGDALGYYIYWNHIAGNRKSTGTVQL